MALIFICSTSPFPRGCRRISSRCSTTPTGAPSTRRPSRAASERSSASMGAPRASSTWLRHGARHVTALDATAGPRGAAPAAGGGGFADLRVDGPADPARPRVVVFEWSANLYDGVTLRNTVEELERMDARGAAARSEQWGFMRARGRRRGFEGRGVGARHAARRAALTPVGSPPSLTPGIPPRCHRARVSSPCPPRCRRCSERDRARESLQWLDQMDCISCTAAYTKVRLASC